MKKWSIKLLSVFTVMMLVVGCGTTDNAPTRDDQNEIRDSDTNLNRNDNLDRDDRFDENQDRPDDFNDELDQNEDLNRNDTTNEENQR